MSRTLLSLFALIIGVLNAGGQATFQKVLGTPNYEEVWGLDLTFDGGFILGGYTNTDNALLIKLNSNDDTLWTKIIDAGGTDLVYSIGQTKDTGFIAAGRTSGFGAGGLDVLLMKTDPIGNSQWMKTFGGSGNETANCVKQTMDGGYILAGNTYSFGAGSNDFYIVKTNSSGNLQWTKSVGGSSSDNAYSITQTEDSGYVATGFTASAGAGGNDALTVKFDKNGNMLWMKTYGGPGDDRANAIKQTRDGGFIISGVTNSFGAGSYDYFLLKTDSAGGVAWSKTYGGAGDEWSYDVQQTKDHGFILAGYTTSFGAGGSDYYLIKTDSIGDTLWTRTFGGPLPEYGTAVKEASDKGYAVLGYGQSFAVGSYDFYFVKTDSLGSGACNQHNTNSIVGSPAPVMTIPVLTVLTGGLVNSSTPNLSYGVTVNSICSDVGIQPQNPVNLELKFYPNPFNSQTILETEHPLNDATLTLYDTFGQPVKQIGNISGRKVSLSRGDLPAGLYFIRVSEGGMQVGCRNVLIID